MIRAQRIIADSIKDHLIPQVSSKKTPKEMYDALSRMYEGKHQQEDESKSSTEKHQDESWRIHPRLLHEGFLDQRATRIYWRSS